MWPVSVISCAGEEMPDPGHARSDRRLGAWAVICYVAGPICSIGMGVVALEVARSSYWYLITGAGIGLSFLAGCVLLIAQATHRPKGPLEGTPPPAVPRR